MNEARRQPEPYTYRGRVSPASLLTSIVHVGMDPTSSDESRELVHKVLDEKNMLERQGVLGHTIQAARAMIEEMEQDARELRDPLEYHLPGIEIDEPDIPEE